MLSCRSLSRKEPRPPRRPAALLPVCPSIRDRHRLIKTGAYAPYGLPFFKFINTAQESLYYFSVNPFIQISFVKLNKTLNSVYLSSFCQFLLAYQNPTYSKTREAPIQKIPRSNFPFSISQYDFIPVT